MVSRRALIEAAFPNLVDDPYEIQSPSDPQYNCIAWAVGINSQFWDPTSPPIAPYYWPPNIPSSLTVEAYSLAFATIGFTECSDGELEHGYIKIALYVGADGVPKHAARQLPSGRWTSKLGSSEDLEHGTLEALAGDLYGTPVRFFRKPIS